MRKMRIENDQYYTSSVLAERLLSVMEEYKYLHWSNTIFEPCNGIGGISQVFRTAGYQTFTNDIDSNNISDYCLDAKEKITWSVFDNSDWVITNPPFKDATPILENAWQNCSKGMAILLRLSFLEPVGNRRNFLEKTKDHLTNIVVVNPRPQFRNDSLNTDSVTVAWFIWQKEFSWKQRGIPSPYNVITDWKTP